MNYEELNSRLKDIKIENYIWLIYIVIIFMSWYANSFEKKYFIFNNIKCREKYRKLMFLIFSILIVIYLYFLKDSYDDIKELSIYDSSKKINLTYLSFIGSLLIAISGFIYLYIIYLDENIDVEIAFN